MASNGLNTNENQFFITHGPTQWLDSKLTIFKWVGSGMHVVKRLGMIETDATNRPIEQIII